MAQTHDPVTSTPSLGLRLAQATAVAFALTATACLVWSAQRSGSPGRTGRAGGSVVPPGQEGGFLSTSKSAAPLITPERVHASGFLNSSKTLVILDTPDGQGAFLSGNEEGVFVQPLGPVLDTTPVFLPSSKTAAIVDDLGWSFAPPPPPAFLFSSKSAAVPRLPGQEPPAAPSRAAAQSQAPVFLPSSKVRALSEPQANPPSKSQAPRQN